MKGHSISTAAAAPTRGASSSTRRVPRANPTAKVPAKYIHAPWTMPALEQQMAGCTIGRDYPLPVVDHAERRLKALALYKAVKG